MTKNGAGNIKTFCPVTEAMVLIISFQVTSLSPPISIVSPIESSSDKVLTNIEATSFTWTILKENLPASRGLAPLKNEGAGKGRNLG